ncbi:MAG TPA: glycosyltransferase family 61 protein [Allocoleopsis sp.]
MKREKIKSFLRHYWRSFKEIVRTIQVLLIKFIRIIPVSSEIFGPPQGVYPSTAQWLASQPSKESYLKTNYLEIYPSQLVRRTKPGTLDKKIHWKFALEYDRAIPASFVTVVPQGRIWVNKGSIVDHSAVITEDDRILADLSQDFTRTPRNHSIFTHFKLPPVHSIEGLAVVLTSAKANIYFHWMSDLLPRLELLRLSGFKFESIDKFIINSSSYPFQKETLSVLGIPQNKLVDSSHYPHIKAEKLLVPSLPSLPGNPPSWVCEFLRIKFLPRTVRSYGIQSSMRTLEEDKLTYFKDITGLSKSDRVKALEANQGSGNLERVERIYISRANASYRRTLNEVEVTDVLKELGFKIVRLELMTVAEQAILFNCAQVVVAPHGAGLTNIVFCQPGTKVIEFFSPQYVNVCYWSLANQVRLDYYYILGEGRKPQLGVDLHLVGEDILVNLDELSMTLKLAGVC